MSSRTCKAATSLGNDVRAPRTSEDLLNFHEILKTLEWCLPERCLQRENDLIVFYRDFFIPAQYDLPFHIPNLSALRASDWEDCRTALQNEDIGHALIARFGHSMTPRTSEFLSTTLDHQHKSTVSLLRKVQQGQIRQDFDSYFHINMLFSAETLARNLQGAQAHGKILQHMFREAWELGSIDYKLLLYQLYNDCQLSSMFLVRPIFDPNEWLPMVWAPVWAAVEPYLPRMHDGEHPLDPSIQGTLGDCFRATRYQWTVINMPKLSEFENHPQTSLIMAWFLSNAYIYYGRFVNHYLDVREIQRSSGLSNVKRRDLLTQKYVAVAAIYHLKTLARDPKVFGMPLFDARPSLLPALRRSLDAALKLSANLQGADDANARLWALYVGAMSEHANETSGSDPHAQWFNSHLAKQAMAMRIHSWDEAKPILQGFLYFEKIPPNGSLWFARTLAVQQERLLKGSDYVEQVESTLPQRQGRAHARLR